MRPNIFLGTCEGSTQYKKWYFEVMVDHVEPFLTAQPYHLRVGWALTEGYSPYPGGGEGWGGNGVGDDLYSYGFDGLHLWSGKAPDVRTKAVHHPGRLIFWFHLNIRMNPCKYHFPSVYFCLQALIHALFLMEMLTGRVPRHVASPNQHILTAEDVVSCCLDLSVPSISFRINGHPVQGMFENFNLDGLFFPVVSFSAGVT